ncbi:UNVERIFIED_CONTAM: hypothetical protein RMT77_004118 [Armadillidium vulgare]
MISNNNEKRTSLSKDQSSLLSQVTSDPLKMDNLCFSNENEDINQHSNSPIQTKEHSYTNDQHKSKEFTSTESTPQKEEDKVCLKQEIGFVSCVGIIVGTVIGSGIFISPKGVLLGSGSIGLTLIIWTICGFFSFMGALAFSELGTLFPESGGQYVYYLEGFAPKRKKEKLFWGPLIAFLYSWVANFFHRPAGLAIQALACSKYLLKLTSISCKIEKEYYNGEDINSKILASTLVVAITTFNCYSVKFSTRVINALTAMKLLALLFIIYGGIAAFVEGERGSLDTGFEGSKFSYSGIALAFYSGLWAYAGWDNIVLVAREIQNPRKNIIRAMLTSCTIITLVYLATNVSYFILLSKSEFLSSDAVAVEFAEKYFGFYGGLYIVISVASSIFGSTMGGSFTAVRIAYAAAREGHLPDILSFLNIRHFTPTVAYLLNCFLSLLLIVNSSILGLIFLAGLLDSFFMGLAVALVFVFRITRKNEDRIKVNLVAPAISFLFYVFLVVTPFIEKPKLEYSYVLVILFSGFVFYVPFVYFGLRWRFLDVVKEKLQIFLEVSPPEDEEIR